MKFRKRISFVAVLCAVMSSPLFAQEVWDLRRCVEYAQANNISVRQSDVQARIADLTYHQNKLTRVPNGNFSTNTGFQFGRSIDPTTNLFTNQQLLFQGFQFNTDVTIFNWNRVTNNIQSAKYGLDAASADVERNKNDIALNVATAYLQALLSKVQINIARVQFEQTSNQLSDTRKRVDAGTLPELNAVDLEAQAARDSSNIISAEATYQQNLLNLKALLNLDAGQPFEIATPDVERIPVDPIAELQPELVFQLAMKNQPAQKANELRLRSLEYTSKAARGQLYPTISAFGSMQSNFANSNLKITDAQFLGYNPPNTIAQAVNVNGAFIPVQNPNIKFTQEKKSFGEMWSGWGNQLDENFRQSVGVVLSVPIFNGYQAKTNYERSKWNVKNQQLVIEQANQKLKQDIYTAYNNAVAALQKYNASRTSFNAAQKAYDFASKRYGLGLLSTLELITSQTNLTRSRIDMANAQYDYVFRMKVLEFYKGQGIKL